MPAQRSDPLVKTELVERIDDHVLEQPLSGVTFRNLAEALGVSTFTLVYHFGTRRQMLRDVVRAVYARADSFAVSLETPPESTDEFVSHLEQVWEQALLPQSVALKRLEFDAALQDFHDPEGGSVTRELFARWCGALRAMLIALGLPETVAATEARLIVTAFFGFQFDLIVNRDDAATDAAFRYFADGARKRLSEWGNGFSR